MIWPLETEYDVINQHLLYAGNMQIIVSLGAQSGNSEPGEAIIQSVVLLFVCYVLIDFSTHEFQYYLFKFFPGIYSFAKIVENRKRGWN